MRKGSHSKRAQRTKLLKLYLCIRDEKLIELQENLPKNKFALFWLFFPIVFGDKTRAHLVISFYYEKRRDQF